MAKGIPFKEAVLASPTLAPHINKVELDTLCNYQTYTGTSAVQVDAVLAHCSALSKTD